MKKLLLLLSLASTLLSATVYQDHNSMDASKWKVYDNTPSGATIKVLEATIDQLAVVELKGSGTKNGYMLGSRSGSNAWNNTMSTNIMWGLRFNENFVVYISVQTQKGHRYLYYTPVDRNYGINSSKTYIHHGLGSNAKDGQWRGFERDLEADLKEFEPDNSIISVNALLVRGAGMISEVVIRDDNYAKMVAVSSDNSRIVSSNGETISVLRNDDLRERPSAVFKTQGSINDIALSADGNTLFVVHDNSLELIDLSIPYAPSTIKSYPINNALSISLNDSNTKVYIGTGKDGVVALDVSY